MSAPPDPSGPAPSLGRIRTRRTFSELTHPARRGRSGPIWVSYVPVADACGPQVAYAIGRRHGNAVARNRLRRRLRAAVAAAARNALLAPGAYLVGARPGAGDLAFSDLEARATEALQHASPVPRQ